MLLAGVFLLVAGVLRGGFVGLGLAVPATDFFAPLSGVLRGARRVVDFPPGVGRVLLVPLAGV